MVSSFKFFSAVAAAGFVSIITNSAVFAAISVTSTTPKQGSVVEVTVTGAEASSPHTVTFNGATTKLFDSKDSEGNPIEKALIGIPADLRPGKYTLTAGGESIKLTVKDGQFPLQHLRLPPGKDNFLMSPGEKEGVEAAKKTCSDERLWKGAFKLPSKSRQSAAFGLKRMVNGKLLEDYFHSGLDFAAPMGSPITATANGKVILAHNGWRLHGNIVAVDHGQGVISFYLHMSKIAVKEGDEVTAGQKLGAVGSTGRATGPHLHFSIYVNEVATDPQIWFHNSI